MMMNFSQDRIIKPSLALILLLFLGTAPAFSYAPDKGMSAAELLQDVGVVATLMALLGLILIEFYLKKRISRGSYKWSLFVGLFMLPVISIISSTTTLMHETTTVQSCASCHIMEPFVNDMHDENSATLAARHFKNKWITSDQCYHCHTSYGIHGTAEAKRDGFRHWLLYVTDTWPDPITFKGSYPNSNCITCHGETKTFRSVNSHIALSGKLRNNEVSCSSCHGPVHPTPLERESPSRTAHVIIEEAEREKVQALSLYIQGLSVVDK